MNYLLNLSLPVYFMLLPLGIAVYLANKYYKWKAKYYALKENANATLLQSIYENRQLKEAIESRKETQALAKDIIKDLTEKCHKLESDAVEREILVRTLRADLSNESEILQGRIKDKNDVIDERNSQIEYLNRQIERKRLEIQDNELAVEQLKDINDVLYNIVQANSRTRKAYDKYITSTIVGADESAPLGKIIHDSLGNATVHLADQSKAFNNRSFKGVSFEQVNGGIPKEVYQICNEVNRGFAEQAERIRQELEVVDMSTLESGDSVKLRNNEIVKVLSIEQVEILGTKKWLLGFGINGGQEYYNENGVWGTKGKVWEWDIIQIIKPERCYKSNKPCEFGCNGLCKESQ